MGWILRPPRGPSQYLVRSANQMLPTPDFDSNRSRGMSEGDVTGTRPLRRD